MGFRRGVSSGQEVIEDRIDGELSRLITEVTNEINWYMRECNVTRADLASRMGVSPGRVSQVLSGGENLTLRTLAGLATALDGRFEVELRPHEPVPEGGNAGHGTVPAHEAVVEEHRPVPATDRF